MKLFFTEMHGEKVDGVSRSIKHCVNIIKVFSVVKKDDFTMIKQAVLVSGLCLETKQN